MNDFFRLCFTIELSYMHRGLFILQVLAEAAAAVASIAALIRIFRDYCLDDALSRKNRVFYKAMATVSVLDMELVPLLPLAGVEPEIQEKADGFPTVFDSRLSFALALGRDSIGVVITTVSLSRQFSLLTVLMLAVQLVDILKVLWTRRARIQRREAKPKVRRAAPAAMPHNFMVMNPMARAQRRNEAASADVPAAAPPTPEAANPPAEAAAPARRPAPPQHVTAAAAGEAEEAAADYAGYAPQETNVAGENPMALARQQADQRRRRAKTETADKLSIEMGLRRCNVRKKDAHAMIQRRQEREEREEQARLEEGRIAVELAPGEQYV